MTDLEPQEDNFYLLKCLVIVVCFGEVLVCASSVFVLVIH